MDKSESILAELKKRGFRITRQKKLLIDIIASGEYYGAKEIYYEAIKKDPGIGIATTYRMVRTLEEIGAIDRKIKL